MEVAMNGRIAVRAGVAGALAMTGLMLALRASGATRMNLEMMLGSLVTARLDPATWLLGFGLHLAAGAGIGLLYASLMEALRVTGASVGLGMGIVHSFFAGLALPLSALVHPLVISRALPDPGVLASQLGSLEAALFVFLHLLFGAIVGGVYGARRVPMEGPALP
jgi:hypothetical protein